MMTRPLILIIGPSGSGKTLLVENIKKEYPYLKDVESYTTRPPRYEVEKGHVFITQEEFDKLDLIAHTHFHGYDYGVDRQTADDADLYVIDKAGIETIRETGYDKTRPIYVLGLVLSEEECKHRLIARGDSMDNALSRLENDKIMFEGYESLCDNIVYASQSPEKVLADSLKYIGQLIEPSAFFNHKILSGAEKVQSHYDYGDGNSVYSNINKRLSNAATEWSFQLVDSHTEYASEKEGAAITSVHWTLNNQDGFQFDVVNDYVNRRVCITSASQKWNEKMILKLAGR